MNSYPAELLVQLAPVMFIAGLSLPPQSQPQSPPPTAQSPISSTPITQGPQRAISPNPTPQVVSPTPTPPPKLDPFTHLSYKLCEAFRAQRKMEIWQPDKSKVFQVVFVDKEVRFPPRKLAPPTTTTLSAPPPPPPAHQHSPLSPLSPSSPLYPDGLIAPIWIRKHTSLVPSVFVLFLRLYESPPPPQAQTQPPMSPLHDRERAERDRLEREERRGRDEEEERRRDGELAGEVAIRKKVCAERGVKLTVVLMASRRMLDDPSLDTRLTYIRRQSGLDARASLFVLSPVTQQELNEFVHSIQQALWEPSIEYYTSHSKRVRRKRNRHAQSGGVGYVVPAISTPPGGGVPTRPLRPEGWTVRYEYKMACFAEFRGEDEVALKHYQDAYEALVIMFGSTAILPPRTKRWAEAKVLADCVSVKICKLYLYNSEHALALSHHNSHIKKFADFSRGWGIGEETFEFWSWFARQHRILAELLEAGTRSSTPSTLKLPSHTPLVPPPIPTSAPSKGVLPPSTVAKGLELESLRSLGLGLNPSQALMHPGFYYYMAARCTEKRRERFLGVEEIEVTRPGYANSPGYLNEKKVDHLAIILELYTKSYELFKQHTPQPQAGHNQAQMQGRHMLWIAYRIAQTYYQAAKFDMAVRFFERIAKTYRREKWGSMLQPLLRTWYACAQQMGDVELSVRLLVELIGCGTDTTREEGDVSEIEEDLIVVMKSTAPSTIDGPLIVDLSESEPIFEPTVIFWSPEINVNEPAPFQLTLTAPTNISISSLPFTVLSIYFGEERPAVTVYHSSGLEVGDGEVQRVDLGLLSTSEAETGVKEVKGCLRWDRGGKVVFSGAVSSEVPSVLKVAKVVLTMREGKWWIEIPFDPSKSRQAALNNPKWLSSTKPPRYVPVGRSECHSTNVRHRPHELNVRLTHQEPAYLDEEYPIVIDITNTDDRDLDIMVDVLLHPAEIDLADDHITMDDQESNGLIKGVSFGVIPPGVNTAKTLFLASAGAPGDRTIDISIQSRSTAAPSQPRSPITPDTPAATPDMTEVLHTLVVSAVEAIKVVYDVTCRRRLGESRGLADLRTFDGDFRDDAEGAEGVITTTMECAGPWGVEVESVKLVPQDHPAAKVISSSQEADQDEFPSEWLPGDEFCDICRVAVWPDEVDNPEESIQGPGEYEITWRRLLSNGDRGPKSITRFALPSLKAPTDGLIALMEAPAKAKLHTPIPLHLTIRNRHPSRSANIVVQLDLDPTDGFVVAGLRSGRIPTLLPGAEEKISWRLIPIECGFVKVPRMRVLERRSAVATTQPTASGADVEVEGEIVKVVDVRWEGKDVDGNDEGNVESVEAEEAAGVQPTVLVLP
ncbi:hypothetical protein JAAARDRAFT_41691 [Jaapia argillacea MUCL 33604]|uniref:Trafficking protein particle complex subunit 11 domain-containing protein n=1 Tax=Jaapia argillacea MUCL 33604 TaxID=933084 RepID=A0A067P7N8_9AGAM|nr:hypothetical protein JAAARDRAFT_41691 [Jaapia argillacea MUCL 33604]